VSSFLAGAGVAGAAGFDSGAVYFYSLFLAKLFSSLSFLAFSN